MVILQIRFYVRWPHGTTCHEGVGKPKEELIGTDYDHGYVREGDVGSLLYQHVEINLVRACHDSRRANPWGIPDSNGGMEEKRGNVEGGSARMGVSISATWLRQLFFPERTDPASALGNMKTGTV